MEDLLELLEWTAMHLSGDREKLNTWLDANKDKPTRIRVSVGVVSDLLQTTQRITQETARLVRDLLQSSA